MKKTLTTLFIGIILISFSQQLSILKTKGFIAVSSTFSVDSKFLVTGGDYGDATVWDVSTQKQLQYFEGHALGNILASAYSPNLVYLATGGDDGQIIVWNTQNNVSDKYLSGHQAPITSLVFSNDAKYLYAGSADKIISVWDMTTNMKVAELRGHEAEVSGLAMSPDGKFLVSSSYDKTVRVWNLAKNSQHYKFSIKGNKVRDVSFHPKGGFVVVASDDKSVRVLDLKKKRIVQTIRGHKDVITKAKYSADGEYIFTGSLDKMVKVWSTETGELVKTYEVGDKVVDLATDYSGKKLVAITYSEKIRMYDISELKIKPRIIKPIEVYTETGVKKTMLANSKCVLSAVPNIKLIQPSKNQKITRGQGDVFLHPGKDLEIIGQVESKNGVYELYINGVEVHMTHGHFTHKTKLSYGNTDIQIKTSDICGLEDSLDLTVQRQVQVANFNDTMIRSGQDYALVIVTNEYDGWNNLQNPVNDGKALKKRLETLYGFEVELLMNPTKIDILKKMKEYRTRMFARDDQLLIFVAGHGHYDEHFDQGYLVCKNSLPVNKDEVYTTYLTHQNFQHLINKIPCKHVMLMMDVCFGGTFGNSHGGHGQTYNKTKRNEIIELGLKYKTRRYITSGGKDYVEDSDANSGGHSPFAQRLFIALDSKGGKDRVLTHDELFSYLERVSPLPRKGTFGNNETGSDFLFIAK